MADRFAATSGSVAFSTSTKTILALATGASAMNIWCELDVSFDGTSSTAAPIQIDLYTFTTDGTGTTGTVEKYGGSTILSAASTFKYNYTVEPSGTVTVIQSFFVHPQTGMVLQFPLGREYTMAASAFTGIRLVTPGAAANVIVNVIFEE